MQNFDLTPPLLLSQASSLAENSLHALTADGVGSAVAAAALATVLLSLPVLLRLVYKQAKTKAQTTEDSEAAIRHFLP